VRPDDDDVDVSDARDEAVIAGRAVSADDAALEEVVRALRTSALEPPPAPSAALRALLRDGLPPAEPADDAPPGVADLAAARTRRRVVGYVAGIGVVAALALGGSAAAAVDDGVPLGEVPGAIGRQIDGTVSDALASIGLAPAPVPAPLPAPEPAPAPVAPGAGDDAAPAQPWDDPVHDRADEVPDQPAGGVDPVAPADPSGELGEGESGGFDRSTDGGGGQDGGGSDGVGSDGSRHGGSGYGGGGYDGGRSGGDGGRQAGGDGSRDGGARGGDGGGRTGGSGSHGRP